MRIVGNLYDQHKHVGYRWWPYKVWLSLRYIIIYNFIAKSTRVTFTFRSLYESNHSQPVLVTSLGSERRSDAVRLENNIGINEVEKHLLNEVESCKDATGPNEVWITPMHQMDTSVYYTSTVFLVYCVYVRSVVPNSNITYVLYIVFVRTKNILIVALYVVLVGVWFAMAFYHLSVLTFHDVFFHNM